MSTAVFAGNTEPNKGKNPTTVENASGNGIGAAMSAIRSSCPNATGNLSYTETVVSSCFAGGFITNVNFYKTPNCPPNQICPAVIEIIGTVTVDCEGNVMNVSCGGGGGFLII